MPNTNTISFFHEHPLKPDRVHEASGMGRECFALALASSQQKLIAWISDDAFRLNPFQVSAFVEPERLIQMRCHHHMERLWVMEEALRSGTFGLVIANIDKSVGLTAGRRLQLAAEAGKTLGLCLIRENNGSNTAETRWLCQPCFEPHFELGNSDSTHWHWHLKKNKTGTINTWKVQWDAQARCVSVVSRTPDQSVSAQGMD